MKIGTIVQPNEKGQIVIPKRIRDQLGITPQVPLSIIATGGSICMYPIKHGISTPSDNESSIEILKKTQGSWRHEDWDTLRKKRRAIELVATRRNKKAW